jgi:hypothetical protein
MSNNTIQPSDAVATARAKRIKSIDRRSFIGLLLVTVVVTIMLVLPYNVIDALLEPVFHSVDLGRTFICLGVAAVGSLLIVISWFQKDRVERLG